MAGEFDPLGGDLYSIMGGIPGGGPVGAVAAGQMQQQNLQEKMAQAELLRQQASQAQAQTQRIGQMTPAEVAQMQSLAQMYQASAGKIGAETGGLNLANIARGANLPGEIGATGSKFAAEIPQEQLKGMVAKLIPALTTAPPTFTNAPNPDLAIDTWGNQMGIAREPYFNGIKQALRSGATAPQLLTSILSANPEQIKTETQVAGGIKEREIGAKAQVESSQILAQSRRDVQASRAQVQQLTAGKTPEAQLSLIDNQLLTETDQSRREALLQERESAMMRVNVSNAFKWAEAQGWMNKSQTTAIINQMLQGQGGAAPGTPNPAVGAPGPQLNPSNMPTPGQQPNTPTPTTSTQVTGEGDYAKVPPGGAYIYNGQTYTKAK